VDGPWHGVRLGRYWLGSWLVSQRGGVPNSGKRARLGRSEKVLQSSKTTLKKEYRHLSFRSSVKVIAVWEVQFSFVHRDEGDLGASPSPWRAPRAPRLNQPFAPRLQFLANFARNSRGFEEKGCDNIKPCALPLHLHFKAKIFERIASRFAEEISSLSASSLSWAK